ncbi:MAG: nucleotidyltransferase domain-containing protein [Pelosinus sp.]|nr:nucleotidyltransferase domain-containing protein [Pelosinus sp.]
MEFGLTEEDLAYIKSVVAGFAETKQAVIFGSRAKGNYKRGSDVDLAVFGEDVSFSTITRLHARLEEDGPLPYFFDVVDFTHSTHKELREHIERVVKTIYIRDMSELI